MVMFHHVGIWPAGYIGVDLFFALSGFLITALLLEEFERRGGVRLGAFYRRRALRLLPALIVLVAVLVAVEIAVDDDFVTGASVFAALFYVTNFALAEGHYSVLMHTWSLSIEEQFYLTWPVLLILARRKGTRSVLLLAALLTLAALARNWQLIESGAPRERFAFGLDARCGVILAGCALAAFMHLGRDRRARPVWALAAFMLIMTLSVSPGLAGGARQATIASASVVLLWSVTQRGGVKVLRDPALRWTGRRAYGLYLWHFPILAIATRLDLPGHSGTVIAVGLVASFVVTGLSYRYIEQPFLRLKDRSGAVKAVPAGPAWSTASARRWRRRTIRSEPEVESG